MIWYDGCTGKEGVLVEGSFPRYQQGGISADFDFLSRSYICLHGGSLFCDIGHTQITRLCICIARSLGGKQERLIGTALRTSIEGRLRSDH